MFCFSSLLEGYGRVCTDDSFGASFPFGAILTDESNCTATFAENGTYDADTVSVGGVCNGTVGDTAVPSSTVSALPCKAVSLLALVVQPCK